MSQKIAVSAVFVAALFMTIMDTTIVNVAVPTLGRQFHTTPTAVASVVIGFLVSIAVFIPASGWLGDRFGGRRVLLVAVVVFAGASALCGFATSLPELVAFRVLQGVGGGLMTPVGMAMLYRVFPPSERVRASSILMVPTALAPALGPVLGGLFVTDFSWRWVFFVNVPIGAAALVFGLLFLDDHRSTRPGPFDLRGFVLAGVGLGLAMYGLSEGPVNGWTSPDVIGALAAGLVLLVAMVVAELRTREPMVALRLYGDGLFRSTTVAMVLGAIAFLGVLYLVALFYQDGLGLSALGSGLSTFPEAIGVLAGAQLVTRLVYPLVGPRRVMVGGLVVVAAAMALMALVGDATSLWWARADLFLAGFGMSGLFIPAQAAAFATISRADTGLASTLFNACRQLGAAIGVAVLTSVVSAVGVPSVRPGAAASSLEAYHVAFLVAAGIALLAALSSLQVSDADAAATVVRRGRLAARAARRQEQQPDELAEARPA